ncbi:protein translocase subunit SecF [Haematomicrobium sanguinis]|uniref:protein translocase subunit SecF n=1 Tax=Haematomicrobium sanguinis TaxID=479106 RepID=UPI00047B8A7D|nr:protein translocase subunit SecF [Haematomicrobium sanguinis]
MNFAQFGNDLYSGKRSFNIVGKRNLWFLIAAIAIAISILIPIVKGGFNLGIDFRGGSEFTISNVQNTDPKIGEEAIAQSGTSSSDPRVTNIAANTMQVQTEQLADDETVALKSALASAYGVSENEVTSAFVGPTWGEDVSRQALIGFIVFVVLVAILMAVYFRTWKMSLAAIVGLLVVLILTVGVYAATGFEVTPSAIIGLLTILGYSLYDTVVVFDKIRENTSNYERRIKRTFAEEVNLAVNQTLVRSINTSVVALLPVAAILFIGAFILGAGTLRDLSLALFVGIVIGPLSTIFIAAPLYAWLRRGEKVVQKADKKVERKRFDRTDGAVV